MDRIYRSTLLAGVVAAVAALGTSAASAQTATTNTTTGTVTNSTTTALGLSTPIKNADGSFNASQVIGMKVVNNNNDRVGKIGELVLNQDGTVHGVVVDVGGFLGMGTHRVLLDWKQLAMNDQNGGTVASVDMSKDALKQLPEYSASK
jgi:sporulation protein YlmC with PRC-barrel domain